MWFRLVTVVFRYFLYLMVALTLCVSSMGDYRPSYVDRVVAPLKYSFIQWELGHLSDKWIYRLKNSVFKNHTKDRNSDLLEVREYFRLVEALKERTKLIADNHIETSRLSGLERKIGSNSEVDELMLSNLSILRGRVEETIETELSEVLKSLQLNSRLGLWPPVDIVLSGAPHILVISPRDEINIKNTFLLSYGLTPAQKSYIEEQVGLLDNHSVLVEDLGGVAVYPSVISNKLSMKSCLTVAAHEWLHHWLFFKPLGQSFWTSHEMTVLNETVATVAGEEIGELLYDRINHDVEEDVMLSIQSEEESSDRESFDFFNAMQETRKHVSVLLGEGDIEEAEYYMDQRAALFRENGYYIRKLNQAYFAFHGIYATTAASDNPIGEQVKFLRSETSSLQEFLRSISGFRDYEEFVIYIESLN